MVGLVISHVKRECNPVRPDCGRLQVEAMRARQGVRLAAFDALQHV